MLEIIKESFKVFGNADYAVVCIALILGKLLGAPYGWPFALIPVAFPVVFCVALYTYLIYLGISDRDRINEQNRLRDKKEALRADRVSSNG